MGWFRFTLLEVAFGSESDPDAGAYPAAQREVAPGWSGRRASIRWARNEAAGIAGDAAMVSLDLVNYTGGDVDSTWTDADFIEAENAIAVWWSAILQYFTANTILDEVRWYRFGPSIAPPQPAVRVFQYNSPGTAATEPLPPQVSVSVTEKTPLRRRWGRMYLPAPAEITNDGNGRIVASVGNAIANATETLYSSLGTAELVPVVYSPTAQRAYSVTGIQVDDLFDVIRSRRHKVTLRRDYRGL